MTDKYLKEFSDRESKNNYRLFLDESINIIERIVKQCDSQLYKIILNQLYDIKENIVETRKLTDWSDIDDRYTIGSLAVQNFEDSDSMRDRIQTIYYGAIEYINLPEI